MAKPGRKKKTVVSVTDKNFTVNEKIVWNIGETKEVSVQNDAQQSLYRRQLALGNGVMTGEVNTSPLTRDYDAQFGYPEFIDKMMFQRMYDRDPVAHRVVQLYPVECWQQLPKIYDSDAPTESDFEKQVAQVFQQHNVWGMLRRIDVLSGIGNFGILLMGVGDGKPLHEPVDYLDKNGSRKKYKLQYVRAFPHSQVQIAQSESQKTNPRYGHPTLYRIQFQPNDIVDMEGFVDLSMQEVHWSRVIHVADNREVSEIYGVPRLQLVYNALLDLEKVFGSSGEMFYKGAYPGYVIESNDNQLSNVTFDLDMMRNQIEKYENNLQRWMAIKNAHVSPLSSSYADPSGHIEVCLNRIAVALGCPVRILLGSERGELASSQDAVIWKKRLMERQISYLTPFVIRPVVQFLIKCGMVDMPYNKDFHVEWPDLSSDTKQEIYEVRQRQMEFMRSYLGDNLGQFMTPKDFLVKFCDLTDDEAEEMLDNAKKYNKENVEKHAASLAQMMTGDGGGAESGGGGMGDMGSMLDMGAGDAGGGLDAGGGPEAGGGEPPMPSM